MAASFHLWSTLGPLFVTSSGPVDGEDWALGNVGGGAATIWVEDYTPSATYAPGAPLSYSIVLTTQDWLGDIQPLVYVKTEADFVNPFGSSATAVGNIAGPVIFGAPSSPTSEGLIFWRASATPGDYAVVFQPLSANAATAPTAVPLTQLSGSPVVLVSAIADPLSWSLTSQTPTSMVFAYTTAASATTENLYMEGFDNNGAATNSAPTLIAAGLPNGTPYFIGYNSVGYGYRYLEIGGALGSGLVGGTFDTSTNAVGSPALVLSLPTYTAFSGLASTGLSNHNTLRLIEGVSNGQAVIQSFINSSSTAVTTFTLSSARDRFAAAGVYDPTTGQTDYSVIAYADAGAVHLELLDENGRQIGSDFVAPGIASFDKIRTLTGATPDLSTRVELDYTVADPNGGYEIEGFIFDTAAARTMTLSGGGLYAGSTFADTFNWGAGVYTVDGGGGDDTLVATSISTSQVTLDIDAAGEVVVNDSAGNVDTLRRFTTIAFSNATVTISGRTLTQVNPDGTKVAATFTSIGKVFSLRSYDANGKLVGLTYPTQVPNDFTGGNRSDILFETETGDSASSNRRATWQMNDIAVVGGQSFGASSVPPIFVGSGDFDGNGYSDLLEAIPGGGLMISEQGTPWNGAGGWGHVGHHGGFGGSHVLRPGAGLNVVGVGDVDGDADSDILFEDAHGNLSVWEMNGMVIASSGAIGNPGKGWTFLGLGDFNADGKSDLLFKNADGRYATWLLDGTQIVGGATLGSLGAEWVYKGVGNFNGLGDSDILFENTTTGNYATWDVANDAISGGGTLGAPGSSYAFAAIGDYTANGKSDILFRNVLTGQLSTWDIDDATLVGGGTIGAPPADSVLDLGALAAPAQPAPTLTFVDGAGAVATWTVGDGRISGGGTLGNPGAGWTALAVGDFYGDGQSDVLFENANGSYATWRTNGEAITGGGALGSANGYTFKGLGDFNGDGISDLLFQNASGSFADWEINGTSIIGGATLGAPGSNFSYAGTGDFTGDGTSDILLTDSSGNYWIWYVNNNAIYASAEIGDPGAGWSLKGIGDLNSDGVADLLFENASGTYASWDLNNATIIGGGTIGNPGSQWTYAGIADLNAAGHASVVFRDAANGEIATWLMNDAAIAGGGTLGAASGYTLLAAR